MPDTMAFGDSELKKIDLKSVPEAQEPSPTLLENVERLRRLAAFCNHDLRSLIGVAQTSLALFIEENPRPKTETEALLHQSFKTLKETIAKLDSCVAENKSPHFIIWIVSDRLSMEFKVILENQYCVFPISSAEAALKKFSEYRPHGLILDSQLKVKVMSDFIKACHPHLNKTYLLGEPDGIAADLLKKWGVAGCLPATDNSEEAVRIALELFRSHSK